MGENTVSILYIGGADEAVEILAAHPEVSVVHKRDAQAAIQYLKAGNKPKAILCELNIPGGSGFTVYDYIRAEPIEDPEYEYIVFILLCHEFKDENFVKAFRLRMDDFFVLPLPEAERLVKRIRYLMNFRRIDQKFTYHMPLIKRLFDIVVATTALVLLSPLLLIVVIAIRLESKGKVYYISKRRGRGLDDFNFYKLRSMRVGADAELKKLAQSSNQYAGTSKAVTIDFNDPCPRCGERTDGSPCSELIYIGSHQICDYWYTEQKAKVERSKATFVKISNDPRVTKVGKFIRNTSIDELPQLINVIKGDMSIVGNRPLPTYEADQLTKKYSNKRMIAPAGITGLWQVELRGKGGVMSEAERVRLDNNYADNFCDNKYSFLFDLKLIIRTAKALFQKDSTV